MAVVAVPFILYLVRFCSPKPCKQYEGLFEYYSSPFLNLISNFKEQQIIADGRTAISVEHFESKR